MASAAVSAPRSEWKSAFHPAWSVYGRKSLASRSSRSGDVSTTGNREPRFDRTSARREHFGWGVSLVCFPSNELSNRFAVAALDVRRAPPNGRATGSQPRVWRDCADPHRRFREL